MIKLCSIKSRNNKRNKIRFRNNKNPEISSPTWARHSFATNLTHAGVERSYIQESMGHSHLQSVTDRYIANYPLEKQLEYNSKLLNLNPSSGISKKDIGKMSKAEMAALLMELMEK